VAFTSNWDEVSFDPDYDTDPIESFEPLVRALLSRSWEPPTTATS
jgi:hypothetical protein